MKRLFTVVALAAALHSYGVSAQDNRCFPETEFMTEQVKQLAKLKLKPSIQKMSPDFAVAYFAMVDAMPPATTTPVDYGYLVIVRGYSKMGVFAVKDGKICDRFSLGIINHATIMQKLKGQFPDELTPVTFSADPAA